MRAKEYFHLAPHNWNCTQAIHKSQQEYTQLSDEDIELYYRPMGGGKAPQGMCGALYAIHTLAGDDKTLVERLTSLFAERAGGISCRELKGKCGLSCLELVDIAEEVFLHERSNSSCR